MELFDMGFKAGLVTLGWLACMALALIAIMCLTAICDAIAGKVKGKRHESHR